MKKLILFTTFITLSSLIFAQNGTPISLPSHSSVYSGSARGYWFIAPVDFTITGLRVPSQAGTGAQYIQVMELTAWNPISPPTYLAQTSTFTTLLYINGATNGVIQTVNIPIKAGKIYGILGTAGTGNSYATGPYVTTVNGSSMTLQRFGYQGNINTGATTQCWGVAQNASGSISRVEMYWEPTITLDNDAGVSDFITPTTGCTGQQSVEVEIRNFGTNQINSVMIGWRKDGLLQTPFSYTGQLDTANGTGPDRDTVTLGNITLNPSTSHTIEAWTYLPNGKTDSVSYNDSSIATPFGFPYPTINLGPNITECPGIDVVLQGGVRDSLRWSNNTTLDSLVVTGSGQYHVSVWENGCESRDTIDIARHPNPPAVDLGPDTTLCFNETLLLDATAAGVTYEWQDMSTGATYTVDTTGTYRVTITDANGCENKDAVYVNYFLVPSVQMFVAPGREICNGVPVTFTAFPATQGSISYQWIVNGEPVGSPSTDPQFKGPVSFGDSVWVQLLTDVCSSAAYPVPSNKIEMIVNPSPKTINGKNNPLENTQETYVVPLAASSAYVWRVSGGTINGDSTKNIVKIDWGVKNPTASLMLVETDAKNCTRENQIPIDVVSIIGIDEQSASLGNIYPNPSGNIVNIPVNAQSVQDITIALYDITGKKVKDIYNGSTPSQSNLLRMDVSNIENGIYLVKLSNVNGSESIQKLTVQH